MTKLTIAIDPGKQGAIALFHNNTLKTIIDIPLTKTLVKKAIIVFKNKDPKVLYKSGKKIGQRPTKIKTPSKYKEDINFTKISNIIKLYKAKYNPTTTTLVLETQHVQMGRGFGKQIFQNFGCLMGIGYSTCVEVVEIAPISWKKHFKLNKTEKIESVKLARKLLPTHKGFTDKKDGRAEAYLIGLFYFSNTLQT